MDLKSYKQIVNGEVIEASKLSVPANDIGFLRGYGVFEYFITYKGVPFHLDYHTERLFNSATQIGLTINRSPEEINSWVLKALEINNDGSEKAVRVVVTGGPLTGAMFPHPTERLIMVMVGPRPVYDSKVYELGTSAVTANYKRPYPTAKTLNYLDGVIRFKANSSSTEIIYYSDSHVLEGTTTNIFAVIEGHLLTPKSEVLYGITRKIILENLNGSIKANEVDFTINDLRKASEVFITNSSKEVWPITMLDGKAVGDGDVGKTTKRVAAELKKYIENYTPSKIFAVI